jgi:hypothetical protein
MAARKTAAAAAQAQPAKTTAKAADAALDAKVQLRPGFNIEDAIAATGKTLNALCKEAGGPAGGMNPSQLRRMIAGQVARVEIGRAAIIAKHLNVTVDKMWIADEGAAAERARKEAAQPQLTRSAILRAEAEAEAAKPEAKPRRRTAKAAPDAQSAAGRKALAAQAEAPEAPVAAKRTRRQVTARVAK